MGWTAEELAEMARADAEIEAEFRITNEEIALGRAMDRAAVLENMDARRRKVAEAQRRYREANREKVAEGKQAIRQIRRSLGLTQAAFGKLLGVSQPTISYWEKIQAPKEWRGIVDFLTRKGEQYEAVPMVRRVAGSL